MSFQVTIKEVSIEAINKGKTKYSKAVVAYDYKGEARTQTLVSFSNPGVFAVVQDLKAGDVVSVETTKDGQYTQWSQVTKAGSAEENVRVTPAPTGKVVGSTYETPQERADNRVRIVRQSSISNAIATLALNGDDPDVGSDDVLELAQVYFDWVYLSDEDTTQ